MGQRTDIDLVVACDDAQAVVRVSGELDLSTAPALEQQLNELVEGGARKVFVNLAELTFIDARGLTALVRGAEQLRRQEGGMHVCSPSPTVRRVLAITGLDGAFLGPAPE
jgi:anti-sigma B factor antagonist